MPGMTDRDHFAAAALLGLLARGLLPSNLLAADAYKVADAMLRERERTNHDAAPAARASVDSVAPQPTTDGRERTDKSPARTVDGTGDTPEPVAWAVMPANRDYCVTLSTRKGSAQREAERKVECGEYATMDDIVVVPLYRHPPCQDFSQKDLTLTDAEREAIERAVDSIASTMPYESQQGLADWKTLRGLLRRLGGGR
jgi:hypothetical protein